MFHNIHLEKINRRICDNYRGITIIPVTERIYGKIITLKLEQQISDNIGEDQLHHW